MIRQGGLEQGLNICGSRGVGTNAPQNSHKNNQQYKKMSDRGSKRELQKTSPEICGFFLSAMLLVVKIHWVVSCVCKNFASTATSLPKRALGSTSSLALGSLSSTTLQSTMLSTNPRTSGQLSASSPTTLSPLALCTQMLGDKVAFNLLADLCGVGSFSLSR